MIIVQVNVLICYIVWFKNDQTWTSVENLVVSLLCIIYHISYIYIYIICMIYIYISHKATGWIMVTVSLASFDQWPFDQLDGDVSKGVFFGGDEDIHVPKKHVIYHIYLRKFYHIYIYVCMYIYIYHIVSADYFSAHQAMCTDTWGILAPSSRLHSGWPPVWFQSSWPFHLHGLPFREIVVAICLKRNPKG